MIERHQGYQKAKATGIAWLKGGHKKLALQEMDVADSRNTSFRGLLNIDCSYELGVMSALFLKLKYNYTVFYFLCVYFMNNSLRLKWESQWHYRPEENAWARTHVSTFSFVLLFLGFRLGVCGFSMTDFHS